jgi:hypothetical protein
MHLRVNLIDAQSLLAYLLAQLSIEKFPTTNIKNIQ